jgi:hypothetical protein
MSAAVHVATIHDKDPCFDLKDVLTALKGFIAGYHWRIMGECEVLPESVDREIERLIDRAELTSEELEKLSERIAQSIELTAVGYATSVAYSEADIVDFPHGPAQLVIRAVDSTFFDVYAKDRRIVEELQRHFKDVRIEDPAHFFV